MAEDPSDIIRRNFEEQFGQVDMAICKGSKSNSGIRKEKSTKNKVAKSKAGTIKSTTKSSKADSFMRELGIYDNSSKGMSGGTFELPTGLHDTEEPVVVKFTGSGANKEHVFDAEAAKKQKKLFMSSFAPKDESQGALKSSSKKSSQKLLEDSQQELEHDIALQRLIEESHILAEAAQKGHYTGADISSSTDISLTPTGKYRLKALDVRLQKLGVKKDTEKMPMNMRKGVIAKAENRQKKIEHEAKEAGIVLAKPDRKSKPRAKVTKRERGLKIEGVGRNTYHGLMISNQEIARVSNAGKRSGGKGKGKGKGKRTK